MRSSFSNSKEFSNLFKKKFPTGLFLQYFLPSSRNSDNFPQEFQDFLKKRYWIPWVIQQKSPGKTSEINLWEISEGSSGQISDTIFEGGLQWIPKKILEPCTRIAGDIFEGIPERLPEKISKVSSKISLRNCSGIARIVLWLILFFFQV